MKIGAEKMSISILDNKCGDSQVDCRWFKTEVGWSDGSLYLRSYYLMTWVVLRVWIVRG